MEAKEKKIMRKRAVGIVQRDGKVAVMHHIKTGIEYYVFPGGGVEENETFEEALIREMKEELSINAFKFKEILHRMSTYFKDGQEEKYYLIEEYTGGFEINGPEKEAINEFNQIIIEWFTKEEIENTENLYPPEAKKEIIKLFNA